MTSISVVFPLFNEEDYVMRAYEAAVEALTPITSDYQIILVNDASTDRTHEIIESIRAKDPKVTAVHNAANKKLGGTLRAGYAVATKDLILYTDADLPFDLHEVRRAVRLLEVQKADVVSAYRFDRTSEGLLRTIYSFFYNSLVRAMFGLAIKDVNFSFKLFKRELLDKFVLKSDGSFIDVEFLCRARKTGAHIIQIGVDYFPRSRGVSTLSSPTVIVKIVREMLALRREVA
ncbi:MAG: glycosyltransferase family 2 protein [Vicinamibacteria bacterium]